jgi:hypothetical protein
MNRLNEHLWSGIIHRSETGEVRKEDDVDFLDMEELLEYIQERYIDCLNFPIGVTTNNEKALHIYVGVDQGYSRFFQTIMFYSDQKCCNVWTYDGVLSLDAFLQKKGYKSNTNGVYGLTCNDIQTNNQLLKLLDSFIEWCDKNPKYAPVHIQKKKKR